MAPNDHRFSWKNDAIIAIIAILWKTIIAITGSPWGVGRLLPLQPSVASVPFTTRCTLYAPTFPPGPFASPTALYPCYCAIPSRPSLWRSVFSEALCPSYGSMSPPPASVLSSALCPLYSPMLLLQPHSPKKTLSPLRSSVLSTALCALDTALCLLCPLSLFNPLIPLRCLSSLLWLFPLSPLPLSLHKPYWPVNTEYWWQNCKTSKKKTILLFPKIFGKTHFIKNPRLLQSISYNT
jgi:hypothetical protein